MIDHSWRIRALLVEQTQLREFIKLADCQPDGATIHDVLDVFHEAGLVRAGTWWTPGSGTYQWLCLHLHGEIVA